MASWTAKWVLAKNAVLAEHGDALSGMTLAMVGLLGAHMVGDEAGPFSLPEILEAIGPGNGQTDDFGHAAVVAEDVLGLSSSDVPTGEGGVEWG